ncbi:MAG: hypothetical protein OXN26_11280 [Gammaproteobacteria bacterium]|nr:hypothetical protein [Gammaproteobacteria bacterium]
MTCLTITGLDDDTLRRLRVHFALPAHTITELYRWRVELFFKWINPCINYLRRATKKQTTMIHLTN